MSYYKNLCLEENLTKSWVSINRNKSEEKKKRGKDINGLTLFEYGKNSKERLNQLEEKLISKSYTTSRLKGFYRDKPGKKTKRLIGITTPDDKIVQKTILKIISPAIIPKLKNGVSFGSVSKGKIREELDPEPLGIQGAMKHLVESVEKGNHWIFKSDIEAFYDTIPKLKLYRKIIKILRDKSIHKLLRKIIFFEWGNSAELEAESISNPKVGIAQGPPLSPMFSNIYLIDFDRKMKKKYRERYVRYADDFIIACRSEEEAKEAEKTARQYLKRESLSLSKAPSKTLITFIKNVPLVFLGLRVTRHKITPKNEKDIIRKIDSRLNSKRNNSSKVKSSNDYSRGIFGSYKRYHTKTLFEQINRMISAKRRMKVFSKLKLLDLSELSPIVEMEIWQTYFMK